MAQKSTIEWTQATWNPWHGCTKVSPGCKHCYMYRDKKRYGQNPKIVTRSKTTFHDPLKWDGARLIFTCSWSDWFIEEADPWRNEAWDVIKRTPNHTYQILTKRPERILENLPADWGNGWNNVWLGTSIENQEYVFRMKLLTTVPAWTRFISAEPLIGPIDFGDLTGVHWIITGGESGPRARPMDLEWAKSIRDQCAKSGVLYFHKQNGGTAKIDGAWGGRRIDGQTWDAIPQPA
ncbi:MAG: phage Gp37/Gp68 family protein [Chloroflexi bacterium]|nr:phage Gp37/Gp68 family protein [Chloroflexota bacterium]